jgi:oligopeptide/dipeptide ABC transporter ATP-binding protein
VKSTPDTPRLRVDHLRIVFPLASGPGITIDAPAVDDVSFEIAPGETLGLVGESGSGKTVTARAILRALTPPGRVAGGRIEVDGQNVFDLDDAALRALRGRRVGMIFQEPSAAIDPVFTIGYQIRETLEVHGLARGAAADKRALELLEAVRMPDPARQARAYAHQLSGGLRQRAMIALALAADPSLLIADEPTTALDATVQADVLDLLRDLRARRQLSVLLITHDLAVIAGMADRVAVMYAGRIVEHASTVDVLVRPAHPYTRALLASMPGQREGKKLAAIPGGVPPLGELPPGCAFAPRCRDRFAPCDTAPPRVTTVDLKHDVRCYLHDAETAFTPA